MKAKILFSIEQGFDPTTKELLEKESINHIYDTETHSFIYTFEVNKIHKIINLIGKIDLTKNQPDIIELIKLCPPLTEKIELNSWKGIGKLTITKYPKIFQCKEFRKNDEGKVKEITHAIPIEDVIMAGQIINKQPMNKWIKGRTTCENIYRLKGLKRYFRNSGTFDYEKAFGCRADYFLHYYYPIKILQEYYKCIDYAKSGKIKKLKEFNIQEKFKEIEE